MREGAPNHPFLRQTGMFASIGAIVTGAYLLLTNFAVAGLGVAPRTASVVVYVALIPVSFFAHRTHTFESRGDQLREGARFLLTHAANLMAAFAVPGLAIETFGLSSSIAFLIVGGVAAVVSFGMLRVWVFRTNNGVAP